MKDSFVEEGYSKPNDHLQAPTENQDYRCGDNEGLKPFDDPGVDFAAASTYNIYHRKDEKEHFIITPVTSKYREYSSPRKALKNQDIFRHPEKLPRTAEQNTYYIRKPYVSFHNAPRTLRKGATKDGHVVCLIHNSTFWRKWKLQFGEQLRYAVDPRGVLPKEYDYPAQPSQNISCVKGYRVRSWRLWGETGKAYHREVNATRKAGQPASHPAEKPPKQPIVDEEIQFSWHSPFSHKTRLYRFDHAALEFYWKGTGTVKETKTCGWFMRFHHLKLCVRVPILASSDDASGPVKRTVSRGFSFRSKGAAFREVCLAKYTSSICAKKAGVLDIYDDVIHRLFIDGVIPLDAQRRQDLESNGMIAVKNLRLYEVIIASAMCMVIGEWQKRATIIAILAAGGEGGGGGG